MTTPTVTRAVARHVPWEHPRTRPAMSNDDAGWRLRTTSRRLEEDGRGVIPRSGEMHFSRVPRRHWDERLRLMKAGGITVVACYVIWIHHEETRGKFRFDGNRDVRAFVELAASIGLDVVLRIGPWAHGEVRNGGFPDWVQEAPVAHRTDDPGYLELVEAWYRRIGAEIAGLTGPQGAIVGVQIENELYDQPGHISTLRRMAADAGIIAGLYTATAWGSADLPVGEVFPLYGGYSDGFWVDHDAPWDPTFRAHFLFSHEWDDPGIGVDVRLGLGGAEASSRTTGPSALFPPATCELGGGMATAYHRRPIVRGRDVAAMALTKLGNGSAWQGYYMYAGGTNPLGASEYQESQSTGYPNDMPRFDYDFQAPIGATGRLGDGHGLLRRQHAFLEEFGEELSAMPSSLPQELPTGVEDANTLRWAVRCDGRRGFVFVDRHQPIEPLPEIAPVQFEVATDAGTVVFPEEPVDLPSGTLAIFPFGLPVEGLTVRWATATPLTVLRSADAPATLVMMRERGVRTQIAVDVDVDAALLPDGVSAERGILTVETEQTVAVELAGVVVLVLDADAADEVWVLDGAEQERRLVLAPEAVWLDATGRLAGRAASMPAVREYRARYRLFEPVPVVASIPGSVTPITPHTLRASAAVPAEYAAGAQRAWAPREEDFGAALRVQIPIGDVGADAELEIEWAGDVLRLLVDGMPVADQFWNGRTLVVDLQAIGATAASDVVVEILPLHPGAPVGVAAEQQAQRDAAVGALISLDAVRIVERVRWSEA